MKKQLNCRICNNTNLHYYLDLGIVPLANNLIPKSELDKDENKFPLTVAFCNNCFLSQLTIVVDPAILFSYYRYQSSISETFKSHCKEMAYHFKEKFDIIDKDLVVDIASNDGCLLKEFKKIGAKVLGVDPATNLAELAEESGIPTIIGFWSEEIAIDALKNYQKAKIMTATNVFAHVDKLNDFIKAVNIMLAEDGIFIIEVPYLLDLIQKTEFDTIYHEHLSYFLIYPLIKLFEMHHMDVFDIEKFKIHGGTIRVYIKKNSNLKLKVNKNVIASYLENEKKSGLHDINAYKQFSDKVDYVKKEIVDLLTKLKEEHKIIAGYGASAKGNTLMNACKLTNNQISYIVDDTPEKQGFYSPGTKIMIVNKAKLKENFPDYILILAWNFADEIMNKNSWYKKQGGSFIIPIPAVKVI